MNKPTVVNQNDIAKTHPIILFDGVCNLCNNTIQFVIKNDEKAKFRFTSLQSTVGQQILQQFKLPMTDFDSFILVEKGEIFVKSTAALRMLKGLGGLWSLATILMLVPLEIRDKIYVFVAQNRYKWFGKKESCWLPTEELKERFL